jgi:hypothetical protein
MKFFCLHSSYVLCHLVSRFLLTDFIIPSLLISAYIFSFIEVYFALFSLWFLAWLILPSLRWRWRVPSKCPLTFNGLLGVITQKLGFFMRYFALVRSKLNCVSAAWNCDDYWLQQSSALTKRKKEIKKKRKKKLRSFTTADCFEMYRIVTIIRRMKLIYSAFQASSLRCYILNKCL